MATGRTNAAIADVLFISRRAVEKHVNSIFSKLGLNARDEQHARVAAVLSYLSCVQASTRQETETPAPLAAGRHAGRHGLMTCRRL